MSSATDKLLEGEHEHDWEVTGSEKDSSEEEDDNSVDAHKNEWEVVDDKGKKKNEKAEEKKVVNKNEVEKKEEKKEIIEETPKTVEVPESPIKEAAKDNNNEKKEKEPTTEEQLLKKIHQLEQELADESTEHKNRIESMEDYIYKVNDELKKIRAKSLDDTAELPPHFKACKTTWLRYYNQYVDWLTQRKNLSHMLIKCCELRTTALIAAFEQTGIEYGWLRLNSKSLLTCEVETFHKLVEAGNFHAMTLTGLSKEHQKYFGPDLIDKLNDRFTHLEFGNIPVELPSRFHTRMLRVLTGSKITYITWEQIAVVLEEWLRGQRDIIHWDVPVCGGKRLVPGKYWNESNCKGELRDIFIGKNRFIISRVGKYSISSRLKASTALLDKGTVPIIQNDRQGELRRNLKAFVSVLPPINRLRLVPEPQQNRDTEE